MEEGGLTFNCIQTHATVQLAKTAAVVEGDYKNWVGLWSLKPSGVIYCTLKAHRGIYSGSGDFPCKAAA